MMPSLKAAWEAWKAFGRKFGDFQARILLVIFYFVMFAPFALAVRWGSDPLGIKTGAQLGWQPKTDSQGTPIERARRQF